MAQPNQYYGPYSTDSTGFRVLIHDQNEWPDVENHGMDISPGILAAILIKRHKVLIITVRGKKIQNKSSLIQLVHIYQNYWSP